MTSSDFVVTETDKEDIAMDLTKALDYLHSLGGTHGDVSEDFVVIDEVRGDGGTIFRYILS